MKFITLLTILLVTVSSSFAQEVFINPTSITLTQQGSVTVIVTNATSTDIGTVTVGDIQVSNGAVNGTFDAGTYTVSIEGNPQQVTVVLWNEPSNGGVSLSHVELISTSATTADQISFQALVASQAQQQIAVLQIQIASLQQSDPIPQLEIGSMEQRLVNIQSAYDELTNNLTVTAVVTARNGENGTNGSNGKDGRNADDTIAYVGMGLGAGALIGTVVNFFTKDDSKEEPAATATSENGGK